MVRVPKGKKDEPLEILWMDSCSDDSWKSLEDHGTDVLIKTVGYFLRESKKSVCVVQSLSDLKHATASITIPRGCITSMKRFRRK